MEACKLGASVAQIVKTVSGEVQASNLRAGTAATTQNTAENYYEQVFGSAVKVLKNGDSFEQFATERPGVNMREYWRQLTEKVCAGVGIPYVLVYPESMQGTVYRGALDMSAVWFKSRHQVMSSAARRIYEYVMEYAIKTDPTLNDAPSDWYDQKLFRIYRDEQKSIRQISNETGISVKSIFCTLKYCKERIRQSVGEDYADFLNKEFELI